MDYLIPLVTLLILASIIKSLFFKVAEQNLNKEDKALKEKQIDLAYQISDLKKEIKENAPQLTPEEIEQFWGKK